MSEFKGTPGPWVEINGSVYAKSEGICAMLGSTSRPIPKANAALIAAAPDLLASLEALLDYAESGWDHFPDVSVNARAAIAKALGK